MDVLKCLSNLSTVGPSDRAPGSHQRHCSAAAGSRTSDGDAGPFVKEKDADAKPLNISTESL